MLNKWTEGKEFDSFPQAAKVISFEDYKYKSPDFYLRYSSSKLIEKWLDEKISLAVLEKKVERVRGLLGINAESSAESPIFLKIQYLSGQITPIDELEEKIVSSQKYLDRSLNYRQKISKARLLYLQSFLDNWYFTDNPKENYYCLSNRLKKQARRLKASLSQKLRQEIAPELNLASISANLIFLEKLKRSLLSFSRDCQRMAQVILKEKSAYNKTYRQNLNINCVYAQKALILFYQSSIKGDIYRGIIEIFEQITLDLDSYGSSIICTQKLLRDLQKEIRAELDRDADYKALLNQKDLAFQIDFNSNILKSEVSRQLDCPFCSWGLKKDITPEKLRATLAKVIKPLIFPQKK